MADLSDWQEAIELLENWLAENKDAPSAKKVWDDMWAIVDTRWPSYRDLNNRYYALPSAQRSGFLRANPELREVWTFLDKYKLDHPEILKFYEPEYAANPGGLEAKVSQNEMYAQLRQRFPNYDALSQRYYSLQRSQRPAFLAANPQLKQAWNFMDTYKGQNPQMANELYPGWEPYQEPVKDPRPWWGQGDEYANEYWAEAGRRRQRTGYYSQNPPRWVKGEVHRTDLDPDWRSWYNLEEGESIPSRRWRPRTRRYGGPRWQR